MIYATKKSGESNERLMSRFKQVVQRSRLILKTKRGRYFERPKTKQQVRDAAVVRAKYRTEKARKQHYS